MTEVRKHQRTTESGKQTTVRHHTRGTGDAAAERKREAWEQRAAQRWMPPPNAADLPDVPPNEDEPLWWAEDDRPPPGEWWAGEHDTDSEDDSAHLHPDWATAQDDEHSGAWKAMVAQNPDFASGYGRLAEQRDAGYEGPIDQDGNPQPERPAGG